MAFTCWHALYLCVEPKVFFDSKHWEKRIILWTISNKFTRFLEIFLHVIARNSYLTSGWNCVLGETLESGRLASTINTKESKALTIVKTKGNFLDS